MIKRENSNLKYYLIAHCSVLCSVGNPCLDKAMWSSDQLFPTAKEIV
jgi:hypothetical protein